MSATTLHNFYKQQLSQWPLAEANTQSLLNVAVRQISAEGMDECMPFILQHNPQRKGSTGAKTDSKSIAQRPCFLCRSNRPVEQMALSPGELATDLNDIPMEILVNPFPIFPYHFTIAATAHEPQNIAPGGTPGSYLHYMLQLARAMEGMAIFYNGPSCGASAPDHFHFQAVPADTLAALGTPRPLPYLTFGITSALPEAIEQWFANRLAQTDLLCKIAGRATSFPGNEPPINLICTHNGEYWEMLMIPRRSHRPQCYGTKPDQFLISPATIDLAGTMILPDSNDFKLMTPEVLAAVICDTTFPPEQ